MQYEPDEQMDLRHTPRRPSTSDTADRTLTAMADLMVRAADIFVGLSRRINLPPADFQKILNWSVTYDRLTNDIAAPHETRSRRCECGSDLLRNVDVCMSCERWQ